MIIVTLETEEIAARASPLKPRVDIPSRSSLLFILLVAYTTDKRLSTVGVSTASGVTKFYLIENFKEIADVLSKLIDKEQAIQNSLVTASDSLNQLQQLKQLRDNGVITAEEFETKKKQILGL